MKAMLRSVIAMITMAWLLASCQLQQELSRDEAGRGRRPLDVTFDWSLHPDADPESMSLYLFPDDGSEPLRYEFKGREGSLIQVPVGRYTAIAFNSDGETVTVNNTGDLHTFELRLRDAYEMEGLAVRSGEVPRAPGTENERMTSAAESLWIARADGLVVDDFTSRLSLTLTPADAVCHYSINVTGVKNLGGVLSLSASLSGMSGSMFPHDGSVSDENVTITFELLSTSSTSLGGTVHSFGHCGRSRTRDDAAEHALHQLTVYAVLTDGTRWYHSYDVTEHVHAAAADGSNAITVDGLELPEAMGGGGFSVSMGEWTSVTENLQM